MGFNNEEDNLKLKIYLINFILSQKKSFSSLKILIVLSKEQESKFP